MDAKRKPSAKSSPRKRVIAAILDSFAVAFPKDQPKDLKAVITVWMEVLRAYSTDQIQAAATVMLQTRKYTNWPAIGELCEIIRQSTVIESPAQGWAEVIRVLPKWSDYEGGPRVEDPIAHQCVTTLGGYLALSMMSPKELQWQEKRFFEHYENLMENTDRIRELDDRAIKALEDRGLKLIEGI